MSPEYFESMEDCDHELPADAIALCDTPAPCSDGFHGALECSMFDQPLEAEFTLDDWLALFAELAPIVLRFLGRRDGLTS